MNVSSHVRNEPVSVLLAKFWPKLYQTRRRSDRSAFVTELLRRAFALFVGCHVRQIELEICRTKTFAPEPDCDADPVVAVVAVAGYADALAPRLFSLEQGTRCEWNQALR